MKTKQNYELHVKIAGLPCRLYTDNSLLYQYIIQICFRYKNSAYERETNEKEVFFYTDASEYNYITGSRFKVQLGRKDSFVMNVDGIVLSNEMRKSIVIFQNRIICYCKIISKNMEAFYYNFFHPILLELMYQNNIFYCHGAGVQHNQMGNIFFLAPRGGGKTTISLAMIENGHKILSDDTLLFNFKNRKVYTLLRAFHVDSRLIQLTTMKNQSELRDYLPGSNKKKVIQELFYKNGIIEELDWPEYLIFPHVDPNKKYTFIHQCNNYETIAKILFQLYMGVDRKDHVKEYKSFLGELINLPRYELDLGQDSTKNLQKIVKMIELIKIGECVDAIKS